MQDARSSRPDRSSSIDWTGVTLLLVVALASIVLPVLGSGPARTARMPAQLMTWDTTVVFGPQIFDSPTGSITQHVEEFSIDLLPGARYILRVENGDSVGDHRPTFADVLVNGFRYIRADSLSGQSVVHKLIEPLDSTRLVVVVGGSAGDFLEISLIEEPDPGFLVFGPETFVRLAEPAVVTDTFVLPAAALAPWRLHLINGDGEGTDKADSAWIRINGTNVVTRSDFNANTHAFAKNVILADTNIVQTRVKGPTSSYVTIRVTATDSTPPLLTVEHPDSNAVISDTLAAVGGSVLDETPVRVFVNGTEAAIDSLGEFTIVVPLLVEGPDTIDITALNSAGFSTTERRPIIRDTSTPALTVFTPDNGTVTAEDSITVSGEVADASGTSVEVNSIPFTVQMDGSFTGKVPLDPGTNLILIVATDAGMNQHQVPRTVIRDNDAPVLAVLTPEDEATVEDPVVLVSGTVFDSTTVTVTGNGVGLLVQDDTLFSGNVTLPEGNVLLVVRATDAAGNFTEDTLSLTVEGVPIPPDPASVAPPLDPTVATTVFAATQFLYTGPDSIQRGMVLGTIQPIRAAVVRGRVLTREGTALSGVKVSVAGVPDLGYTYTRTDGMYDLAVNGGPLTLEFAKGGRLPVQRSIQAPWQDYLVLHDVRLVEQDTIATMVDLSDAMELHVARGSPVTDADGTRQATVMLDGGNFAEIVMPNGSIDTVTTITIRATEYTLGDAGPQAMPAMLPPRSRYTYAVDLSIDEAIAAGAETVRFSEPVAFHVENFLDIPVGTIVPVGSYDMERMVWVPEPNGRVIEITDTAGGVAAIDIDGDGNADSSGALAALGITDDERERLAELYAPGTELWRTELNHFSAIDFNFPQGNIVSTDGPAQPETPVEKEEPGNDPCRRASSIIECENRTLGETVPIVGTPFTLNYRSDRVPGRVAAYSIDIPLTGDSLSSLVQRIELGVAIAGRRFDYTFSPATNLDTTFVWDGEDAYGRVVQGTASATIAVRYVLSPVTYWLPANVALSFGLPCYDTAFVSGTPSVACAMSIDPNTGARLETVREAEWTVQLGVPDQSSTGLAGWSLSPQHFFDAADQALFMGDGTRRRTGFERTMEHIAGNGQPGFSGDGGPATEAAIETADGLALAPDGSIYFSQRDVAIRRIGTDGIINSVPFDSTGFHVNLDVGPDGSLYVVDDINHVIKRRAPDGTISVVAGMGVACTGGSLPVCGDGGPAISAQVRNNVSTILAAPDGNIYFNDSGRIRAIGPDGIIHTVYGGGSGIGCTGDGIFARNACPTNVWGLDMSANGDLLVGDGGTIRRIDPAGVVNRLAGCSTGCTTIADGVTALSAQFSSGHVIAGAPDGSVYFTTSVGADLWRVMPDGIIRNVSNCLGSSCIQALAVAPDGSLLINKQTIRMLRMRPPVPGAQFATMRVPSADGQELHEFDSAGRHTRTIDVLTRVPLTTFAYDSAGRLSTVTDRDGLVTTIVRDGQGIPTGIQSPYGQTTSLVVGASGLIEEIINPANDTIRFTYASGGLLGSMTDAQGNATAYTHGTDGLLLTSEDAAGGSHTLAQTGSASSYETTVTTELNRTTRYSVNRPTPDRWSRIVVSPSSDTTVVTGSRAALLDRERSTSTAPDGTVTTTVMAADPRFHLAGPRLDTLRVTTPGGLNLLVRGSRAVVLDSAPDPLSLVAQFDTLRLNGRIFATEYVDSTRTLRSVTPEGRETVTLLDTLGRVAETQVAGITPWTYEYDTQGRLVRAEQGVRGFDYTYDAFGRLETLTDPLSRVVEFEYDAAGRLTRQLLPDSTEIEYGYDRNGNLVSLTPPGRPAHTFGYTPVNLMADYTAPDIGGDSTATRYTWNADRQLTRIARPDGRNVDIGYDAAGRPDSLGFSRGGLFFTYSPATGNLTGITAPGSNSLAYTYDGSLLKRVEWDGEVEGSVEVAYDNDFRVIKQKVNDTDSVTFQYDDDGLLTGAGALTLTRDTANGLLSGTTLDSVTTSLSYNSFGELSGMTAAFSASTLFQTAYTRDDLGRITRIIETVQGVTDTIDYAYDLIGRLEEVTRNGVMIESYTYDANGNRTSFTGPSGTINATYDDQDRLLTYGSASYMYSAAGELSQKVEGSDTTRYEYDEFGNLIEVELPGGTLIEYVIDGQNRRVGKKVNGQLVQAFVYGDQLAPVAELDSLGNIVARFVYGERVNVPEYLLKSGGTYRVVADHLGSVRLVVNAETEQVAQRIDYDAFGQAIQNTNPGFQPLGFAGGLIDDATALVRFGARDLDPFGGRWTTKDPALFAGGLNFFQYSHGDPVNYIDATGELPIIPLLLGAWALFEAGLSAADFLNLLEVFSDPCSSRLDIALASAFAGASFAAPGGGYAHSHELIDILRRRNLDVSELDRLVTHSRPSTEDGLSQLIKLVDRLTNDTQLVFHEVTDAAGRILHRDIKMVRDKAGNVWRLIQK